MKKREVPLKNYIIVLIVSFVTFGILLYLISLYKSSESYINNSILSDFLSEIKISEIDNYIVDNPNTIIYLSSSNQKSLKQFEKDFKQLITENQIKNEIIYLDTNKTSLSNITETLKNNYFNEELKNKNVFINSIPNLIVFDGGKVVNILYKNNTEAKIIDFEKELENRGVIDND